LASARESTLDYRIGIKGGWYKGVRKGSQNPVSLKGWQSMVEEKIEVCMRHWCAVWFPHSLCRELAKQAYSRLWKVVVNLWCAKLTRAIPLLLERNSWWIALFNEMAQHLHGLKFKEVRRLPMFLLLIHPDIHFKIELQSAITTFREIIRQSWIRRAIRMLTLSQPMTQPSKHSLTTIASLRDKEWEDRERAYHDVAIEDLNSLVRKHNAMAPYVVRRPYYIRRVELEKMYADCAEDILNGLTERMRNPVVEPSAPKTDGPVATNVGQRLRIFDFIREWFARVRVS
jgi:DnaJ homolog subfamily C member 28